MHRYAVLLAAGLALAAGCGAEAEAERDARRECERLRDRVVELRSATVTADHAAHRAAMTAALDQGPRPFIDDCTERWTDEQRACALAAADSAALADCQRSTTP
jgi:hypothetical protein